MTTYLPDTEYGHIFEAFYVHDDHALLSDLLATVQQLLKISRLYEASPL